MKLTTEDKQLVKDVLSQVMEQTDMDYENIFGYQGNEDEVESIVDDFFYDGESLFSDVDYGATKFVLFFNKHHHSPEIQDLSDKMVIKVPMIYDEDYNEPFCEADNSVHRMNLFLDEDEDEYFESCSDYCNTEAQIYKYLDRRGCAGPLTETFYIGSFNDYPFYGAEKVETCFDYSFSSNDRAMTPADNGYKDLVSSGVRYDFDCDNLKFSIAKDWGLEVALNLLYFCGKIDVSDIYPTRNCGIDENHKIKIIDYSSYNES